MTQNQASDLADLISVEEIEAAAKLLEGVIRYTPMESSRPLNLMVGGPVYLISPWR